MSKWLFPTSLQIQLMISMNSISRIRWICIWEYHLLTRVAQTKLGHLNQLLIQRLKWEGQWLSNRSNWRLTIDQIQISRSMLQLPRNQIITTSRNIQWQLWKMLWNFQNSRNFVRMLQLSKQQRNFGSSSLALKENQSWQRNSYQLSSEAIVKVSPVSNNMDSRECSFNTKTMSSLKQRTNSADLSSSSLMKNLLETMLRKGKSKGNSNLDFIW